MTPKALGRLLKSQLDARGLSAYALQMRLAGRVSPQTVYNALAGKTIKSDTLLILMRELGLEIREARK